MSTAQQADDAVATFDLTAFDSPSAAVVTAVADAADADPLTLESLYDAVDPDALDDLFQPNASGPGPAGRVGFRYADYWVVVDADGRGSLYDSPDGPAWT